MLVHVEADDVLEADDASSEDGAVADGVFVAAESKLQVCVCLEAVVGRIGCVFDL